MSKTKVQKGGAMTYTNNTGAAISSGDPVVVGALLCVALGDIAIGEDGELAVDEVHEVPKQSGLALNQGDMPRFDVSAGEFSNATAATGDLTGSAMVWEAAAAEATVVNVKLGFIGTVTA